jgi:hypothetical protein
MRYSRSRGAAGCREDDRWDAGRTVVARQAHELRLTSDTSIEVAGAAQAGVVEIELQCSDAKERFRYLEER